MAIEELTNDALYEAYKHIPGVKGLVDGIQKKLGVHQDQKGTQDYKEGNIPVATEEIKKAVAPLIKKHRGLEAKVAPSASTYSNQMRYAAGLALALASIGAAAAGIPILPVY